MRTEYIELRLTKFAKEDLRCVITAVPKSQWLSWPLPAQLRFGWLPPAPCTNEVTDETVVVAMMSPELIAEVTADLDDSQLDDYLTIIEFTWATFVSRIDEPAGVVAREAEDLLYAEVPEMLKMRFETEARAVGTIVPAL